MSYCRFSSMNWMCDVYVYEDYTGGFIVHVANTRHIFPPIPEFPISIISNGRICTSLWMASHRLNLWCVRHFPKKKIGLPHDGDTFSYCTPSGCASGLRLLRNLGYRVPQSAIDELMELA